MFLCKLLTLKLDIGKRKQERGKGSHV